MTEQQPSPKSIDEALARNLNTEGLIRLKAVEKTIEHTKDKNIDEKGFMRYFETIYNSLTKSFTENEHTNISKRPLS